MSQCARGVKKNLVMKILYRIPYHRSHIQKYLAGQEFSNTPDQELSGIPHKPCKRYFSIYGQFLLLFCVHLGYICTPMCITMPVIMFLTLWKHKY